MRFIHALWLTGLTVCVVPSLAMADHRGGGSSGGWSVSVGVGGFSAGYRSTRCIPSYYAPVRVYVAPAPVYVYPTPRAYGPAMYCPPPVYYYRPSGPPASYGGYYRISGGWGRR